nr:MAG TPA_asm: hypothetical protein [Caudoviricetes sp.]
MHLQILHGHLRAGDVVHQGSQFCHRAINIKPVLIQLSQQRHQVRIFNKGADASRRVYSFGKSFFQRVMILTLHLIISMHSLYKCTVAKVRNTIQHELPFTQKVITLLIVIHSIHIRFAR